MKLMGSLRDQLLKVGLVDKKQVKKARIDKKRQKKRLRGKTENGNHGKAALASAKANKISHDRELNHMRQQKAERKARAAQIRQLIETHRIPKEEGDLPFNFEHNKKIKRIHITESIRNQLSNGKLAIVKLDGPYELVPLKIAEKIRHRDEKCVILSNRYQPRDTEKPEDPYAEYQIPDDLIW